MTGRPSRRAAALAALVILCLAIAASAGAQELLPPPEQYKLRTEYRQWHPRFFSEFRKGFGAEPGTLLDGEQDLGVRDKRTFEVRGALQIKQGHKLRGSYTPLDYDGDVTAQRTFKYGATQFDRFSRVITSIKGGYYTGAYEWDFVRGPRGFLGGLVGAKVFDVDTLIVAPLQGKRETDTLRAPLPVLGVVGRVYSGRLSLEGELSGLSLGNRGSLWELDTTAQIHVADRLALKGGYRRLSLRGEDERDEVRLRLGGWHFGAELSL